MPRQAAEPVVRTVALTRASRASTGNSRDGASTSRPVTRSTPKNASCTAGQQWRQLQQLQRAGRQLEAATCLPAVRQLRSRQVPLPPLNAASTSEDVRVIFAQGKRRRSRSVASSRAAESTGNTVDLTSGSSRGRVSKKRTLCELRCSRSSRTQTNKTVTRKQPAEEPLVACPHCQEKLTPNAIGVHSSNCTSDVYACPLDYENACQWRGSVSQSVDHLSKNHRSVSCGTGPNAVIVLKGWKKASPLQWCNLQTCLGHNFLIEIRKVEKIDKYPKFFGTIRLFGHQDDADRFQYKMLMKTRSQMARVFSYSTTVKAMQEDNTVINNTDSFVFDSSQADIFSYQGKLEIEVSISVMKI